MEELLWSFSFEAPLITFLDSFCEEEEEEESKEVAYNETRIQRSRSK